MVNNGFNFGTFDQEWTLLGRQICQAIYTNPDVQKLKYTLEKNGFLSLEEKSQFINFCNLIKYQLIYKKFGPEGSEGYKNFSQAWQNWFQAKGVESAKDRGQRGSVDHILFGSTPDPAEFLLNFEHEILGSMK